MIHGEHEVHGGGVHGWARVGFEGETSDGRGMGVRVEDHWTPTFPVVGS